MRMKTMAMNENEGDEMDQDDAREEGSFELSPTDEPSPRQRIVSGRKKGSFAGGGEILR